MYIGYSSFLGFFQVDSTAYIILLDYYKMTSIILDTLLIINLFIINIT